MCYVMICCFELQIICEQNCEEVIEEVFVVLKMNCNLIQTKKPDCLTKNCNREPQIWHNQSRHLKGAKASKRC